VWVPSLANTGARVALEAMAAGRPVIASRWPALAEVVVHGETGYLVDPGSKIDLAQKSRQLLGDAGLRCRLGVAGRRRAEEIFSPDGFAASWQRACSEVAA
jgi:glycosyltransferase involved in cell wall biosynthesis